MKHLKKIKFFVFIMIGMVLSSFFISQNNSVHAASAGTYVDFNQNDMVYKDDNINSYLIEENFDSAFDKPTIGFRLESTGVLTLTERFYTKDIYYYSDGADNEAIYISSNCPNKSSVESYYESYSYNYTELDDSEWYCKVTINNVSKYLYNNTVGETLEGFGECSGSTTVELDFAIIESTFIDGSSSREYYYSYRVTYTVDVLLSDSTPPTISGASNGTTYFENKTISWSDNVGVTYANITKDGSSIHTSYGNANYTVSSSGSYEITARDAQSNQTTISFKIDKSSPSLTGFVDDAYYSTDVTVKLTDNISNCRLYSKTISSGSYSYLLSASAGSTSTTTFTNSGHYYLKVCDYYNSTQYNVSYYEFILDKTAPVISANEFNTSTTSLSVSDTLGLKSISVKYNGVSKVNITTGLNNTYTADFDEDGTYVVTATNKAGLSSTETFYIDSKSPTFNNCNVSNGSYYKSNITLSNITCGNDISHANNKVELYNSSGSLLASTTGFPSAIKGYVISTEGQYKLKATDLCGNTSELLFYLDKTSPTFFCVSDGEITNQNITAYFEDTYGIKEANYVKDNGSPTPFTSGYTFTESGSYTLTATDNANISSTVSFIIDKINPTLRIYTSENTIVNGGTTLASSLLCNKYVQFVNSYDNLGSTEGTHYTVTITNTTTNSVVTLSQDVYYAILGDTKSYHSSLALAQQAAISYQNTLIIEYTLTNSLMTTISDNWYSNEADYAYNGCKVYKYNNYYFVNQSTLNNYITTLVTKTKPSDYTGKISDEENYLNTDGSYKITITDQAGNSVDRYITIDTVAPTAYLVQNSTNLNFVNGMYPITLNGNLKLIVTGATEVYLNDVDIASSLNSNLNPKQGTNTILLKDGAQNQTIYTFYYDSVGPTIEGIVNNGYYNKSLTISLLDASNIKSLSINGSQVSTTINNSTTTYTIDSSIYSGELNIVVVDELNNSSSYKITMDYTNPTILVNSTSNAVNYKQDVTITFSDASGIKSSTFNATYVGAGSVQNQSLQSGKTFTEEGTYTISIIDNAGNEAVTTFTIDRTAPSFSSTSGINVNGYVNKKVTLEWTEENVTGYYVYNSQTYTISSATKKIEITASAINEGVYEAYLIDLAGNVSEKTTFIIDTTATGISLSADGIAITENSFTNKSVVLEFSELATSYYEIELFNSTTKEKYTGLNSGSSIPNTQNGKVTIYSEDYAGNTSSFVFYIDTIAPTASITNATLNSSNSQTNTYTYNPINSTFALTWSNSEKSWSADVLSATHNGISYTNGTSISGSTQEGTHTFKLKDSAGNESTFIISYDITNPVGTLHAEGNVDLEDFCNATTGFVNNVTSKNLTNGSVTFTWSEDNCYLKVTYQGINNNYNSKYVEFTEEGEYLLTLIDEAGNSNTYSFEIDYTKLNGTLTNVSNGGITNKDVTFSWSGDGFKAYLNNVEYIKGNTISNSSYSETNYTIDLYDQAGNKSTYNFTIDTKSPEGVLSPIANGGITNQTVTFTWTDSDVATCTLNGENYSKGQPIVESGSYIIVLADVAGNKSITYTFTIDLENPTIELIGVENEGVTNQNVTFSNKSESLSSNSYVEFIAANSDYVETSNFPTTSYPTYTEEGYYTIYLYDVANNVTVYTFEIDLTAPEYLVYDENYQNDNERIQWNKNVYISWSEDNVTATYKKDGGSPIDYSSKSFISEEGTYVFSIKDKVGNVATKTIIIDKTPDYTNYNNVKNSLTNSTVSHWWETYVYTWNSNTLRYQESISYSFSSYEDALSYAQYRERQTIEQGIYTGSNVDSEKFGLTNIRVYPDDDSAQIANATYYIYKNIDNANEFILYYNQSSLSEAILHYAEISIKEYNIFTSSAPKSAFEGYTDSNGNIQLVQNISLPYFYLKSGKTLSFTNLTSKGNKLYVNGVEQPYTYTISSNGTYNISEFDAAGNETTYIVIVDTTAPELNGTYENGSSTIYNFKNELPCWVTNPIKISCYDSQDPNAVMKITNKETSEVIYLYNGESYLISNTGIYEIQTKNISGCKFPSSTLKEINFSNEKMSTKITPNYETKNDVKTLTSFTYDIFKNNKINSIVNIIVNLQYEKNGELYTETISTDANGLTLNSSNYSYTFSSAGIYQLKITDNFGRIYEEYYTFEKEKPIGYVYNAKGEIQNSGSVTVIGNTISNLNPVVLNTSAYVTWTEAYTAQIIYQNGPVSTTTPYTKQQILSKDGIYVIKLTETDAVDSTKETHSYFCIQIDTVAPVGSIKSSSTNEIINTVETNQNLYFTWDEANATCTLAGSYYEKGTILTEEGTYNFVLSDVAGNTNTYSIKLDKTVPQVTIISNKKEIENGSKISSSFKFTWTELNVTARVNGYLAESGTVYSANGNYILQIIDKNGNIGEYTITIYKAPIQISITTNNGEPLTNGSHTNKNVSITWDDSLNYTITMTLNGIPMAYPKGELLTEQGVYLFNVIDDYGNTLTESITIDKEKPTGYWYNMSSSLEVEDNSIINHKNMIFKWDDKTTTVILTNSTGSSLYYSNTKLTTEGLNLITITDQAGNESVYTITLDFEKPTALMYVNNEEIYNDAIVNKAVTITWDTDATVVLNNSIICYKEMQITAEGKHSIVITDLAGNSNTYKFEIDYTLPTATLLLSTGETLENGGVTHKNVLLTWSESNCTAIYNDLTYYKNTTIKADGIHSIVLTDIAGNSNTYTFTIDSQLPEGTLYNVEENGVTNQEVYFLFDTKLYTASYSYNTIINSYKSNQILFETGSYVITLTKLSTGLQRNYEFTIDTIAPEGILSPVSNGGITNQSVTFSWNENNCTAYLDGERYYKNMAIRKDGLHEIIIYDVAGNSNTYSFTIDTVAPTATLVGVENNGITNTNVTISYDLSQMIVKALYYKDETKFEFENIQVFTETGSYKIELYDVANNITTYNFTIDKVAPTGQFYNAESNELITLPENLTIDYNFYFASSDSKIKIYMNDNLYTNKSKVSETNEYTFVIYDSLGNSNTYYIILDKSFPVGSLVNVENEGVTNQNVQFLFTNDLTCYYIKEDAPTIQIPYVSGEDITEHGKYTIYLSNYLNHITTYSFEIDKVAAEGSFVGLTNGNYTNSKKSYFTWSESNCTAYLDGERYYKNTAIKTEGTHVITLYDFAGNESVYTMISDYTAPQCVISTLTSYNTSNQPVIISWANEDVKLCMLNDKEIQKSEIVSEEGSYQVSIYDIAGNESTYNFIIDTTKPNGVFTNLVGNITNQTVTFTWTDSDVATCTLNGESYLKNQQIKLSGSYLIELIDYSNNVQTYEFIIDKVNPLILGVENNGYYSSSKLITIEDENGIYEATISHNNSSYTPFINNSIISEEGSYSIIVLDNANNKTELSFILDFTAPTFKNITNGGYYNSKTIIAAEDNYDLESISIIFNNGEPKQVLSGYAISSEGTYVITACDGVGNQSIITVFIDKTKPTPEISIANGGITNQNVTLNTINCEDFSHAYYEKDGIKEELLKGVSIFDDEGEYVATIVDVAGNEAIYTWTIDLTPPNVKYTGLNTNMYASTPVIFTWDENYKAYLNDSIYSSGNVIRNNGSYVLSVTDQAGNTSIYEFVIDAEEPTIELIGVANGGITNSSVFVDWTEDYTVTYTINGSNSQPLFPFYTLSEEGIYNILVYKNSTGITKEYSFEIDLTGAVGYLDGIKEGQTNSSKNVSFSWDEENAYALLNGNKYKEGTVIQKEGLNRIELFDAAGNKSIYLFTLDYTSPTYELSPIENNGTTNEKVILSWTEEECSLYVNGEKQNIEDIYTFEFTEEGNYTVELEDKYQNKTNIFFEIDLSSPEGLFYNASTRLPIDETKINYNFYFTWNEAKATCTLNGESYLKNQQISKEGIYEFKLSDQWGNSSIYNIIVDKTNPLGKILGINENGYSNNTLEFIWDEELDGVCSVKYLYGEEEFEYSKGELLDSNGQYIFTITDDCGNSNTYTGFIDTIAPEGILSPVSNGGITNQTVTFTWSEDNLVATLNNVETYYKGSSIKQEGIYSIELKDLANNITTYNFTIDTTKPTLIVNNINQHGYSNSNITLTSSEQNASIKYIYNLEEFTYSTGDVIEAEGEYTFIITDLAGNSNTYTGIIDTTAPEGNFSPSFTNGITANNVSFSTTEKNTTAYLDGERYYYGNTIKSEGLHEIIIYDQANNSSTYTFTIDKSLPSMLLKYNDTYYEPTEIINYYPKLSFNSNTSCEITFNNETLNVSNEYELDEEGIYTIILTKLDTGTIQQYNIKIDVTAPTLELIGTTNGGVTSNDVRINWSEKEITVKLNTESYFKNSLIDDEGNYVVVATDKAGNESIYSFTINRQYPYIEMVQDDTAIVTKDTLTINQNITINFDAAYTVLVNNVAITNGHKITDDGEYKILATNPINSLVKEYSLTIYRQAPTGELDGVKNGELTINDVRFTWVKSNIIESCTLNGESYYSGTRISKNGSYEIILSDIYGNKSTYTFTIDKQEPYVTFYKELISNDNEPILEEINISKKYFNFDVIIKTESRFLVFVNENEIKPDENGYIKISTEGEYLIYVTYPTNGLVNAEYPSFIIDKTKATLNVNTFEKELSYEDEGYNADDKTQNFPTYKSDLISLREDGFIADLEGNITNQNVFIKWNAFELKSISLITYRTKSTEKINPDGTKETVIEYVPSTKSLSKDKGYTTILYGKLNMDQMTYSGNAKYSIQVIDLAGNETIYDFEIHRYSISSSEIYTTYQIETDEKDENGNYITQSFTHESLKQAIDSGEIYTYASTELKLDFSELDDYLITLTYFDENNTPITTTITGETNLTSLGSYEISMLDEYGNHEVFKFNLQNPTHPEDIPDYGQQNVITIIIILLVVVVFIVVVILFVKGKNKNQFGSGKKSKIFG